MIDEQPSIDHFPEQEIRHVARAWASSHGYTLQEPLTIVPLLALVPDGEHVMSVRLEGWTIFAQSVQQTTNRVVSLTFPLKRLAGSVVPDEEPQEC